MGEGEEVVPEASRVAQFALGNAGLLEAGYELLSGLAPGRDLLTNGSQAFLLFDLFDGLGAWGHISFLNYSPS